MDPPAAPPPRPDFSVDGRAVLITGAGDGIGLALARGFAAAGARVACFDLDPERARHAAAACGPHGLALIGDVAEEADVQRAVERTVAAFGGIDVLVNNAAIMPNQRIVDTPAATWDRVLAVNLRGPFLFARAVIPLMAARGGGRIVNVTSALGERGMPGAAAYAASKAALSTFTRVLHQETAELGIRAVAVAPGITDTALLRGAHDAATIERLAAQLPGRRLGRPEDVVGLVLFLASPAADQISGTVLYCRP